MDRSPKKFERIGGLLTMVEPDRRDRLYRSVFVHYGPVVRFSLDELAERKLAAIQLVELGHCTQKDAASICDLHRNTVSKMLELKELLGVAAVVEDHRGLKGPYKYTEAVVEAIEELLSEHPGRVGSVDRRRGLGEAFGAGLPKRSAANPHEANCPGSQGAVDL
jgi:predicted DNA-binding protein (UPF0251 family)